MPNTPNKNKSDNFARDAQRIQTNIGPVGGEMGEIEEFDTKQITVTSITQKEGGEFTIRFKYGLAARDERLKDIEFINGYEQLVEVEEIQPSGTPDILLGWGEILTQEPKVNPEDESAEIVATISPPHFGTPLIGMHVLNHEEPTPPLVDSDPLIHEGEIVFNPEIDGKITGNTTTIRSAVHKTYDDAMSPLMILKLWVDPESMRTESARTNVQRGYKLDKWTLREAVHSLCWVCNPLEEFIINPSLAELDAVDADDVILRNITIPAGLYLPEILNLLLKPHGYSWFLKVGRNGDANSPDYGSTEVRIKVFKLGKGIEKTVYQPKPGTSLVKGGPQNLIEWKLRESFDELRNQVTALGALKEREMTVVLSPEWDEDLDELGPDDLAKDGPLYEKHRNVWRRWIAREAYDTTGTRSDSEIMIYFTGLADSEYSWRYINFKNEFGDENGVHRRTIKECLTLQDKKEGETRRRNPLIEWQNPKSPRTVTFKLHGDGGPPLLPLTTTFHIGFMPYASAGATRTGPLTETTTAADLSSELNGIGCSVESVAGDSLKSGLIVTLESDTSLDGIFYLSNEGGYDTTFSGGLNPGISITDNAWEPIPDGWGPVILGDQLGVFFNGDKAVEDLFAKGSNARIRITGTITGDTRIKYTSEKEDISPLGHVHEMVVDVSDRFFDRAVQRTGPFMSALIGVRQDDETGESGTDEVDSTDEIEDYADRLREIEDAVNIAGTLTLDRIRTEYQIGDLISKIDGRNVSLNRFAADTAFNNTNK